MEAHDLDILVARPRSPTCATCRACRCCGTPAPARSAPAACVVRATGDDLPAEHLGRGRAGGDPARPPLRHHVEPDELRHGAEGHRRRAATARTGRHRRHVAAVRAAAADGVPRRGDRRRRAARCDRPGGSRPPRRSRRSAPPSTSPSAALAAAVAALRARRERARADRRVHGRDGRRRRHDAGDAGRRLDHLAGSARAPGRAGRAGRARRSRRVRGRRRRRRLRRRGRPDLRRSATATRGAATLLAAVGRAAGPAARRVPARRAGQRLLDAYRRPASRCRPMPVARGLGLGFDAPVIVRDLPRDRRRGSASTRASSSPSPARLSTTASARSIGHEPVLITADGPEVLVEPVLDRDARSLMT